MQLTLADAFARAMKAEQRGDRRAARAVYDDILAAIPEHPGALLGIARHHRAKRELREARALLARALASARAMKLPPAELWFELASLEADARDWRAARAAYASVVADAPSFVPALLGAGNAALAMNDYLAAEAHYRAADAAGGASVVPRSGLAQALAGSGRFEEASALVAQVLAAAPADPAMLAAAAWVALRMNDTLAAEAHCRAGLALAPDDPALMRLLARALRARGARGEARRAFEAAVAADPDEPTTRLGLSAALLDMGEPDAARACLDEMIARGWGSAEAFANLGLAWLARDEYEQAATAFARAVDLNPALTPALADLVMTRRYLCDWDGLGALDARLVRAIDDASGDPRISPFVALALPLAPAQRVDAARRWSRAMLPVARAPALAHARGERLRVGYLSGDFRDHPMARVMVGMIEAHERRRVEVFGYSYGAAQDSPLRRRIASAFDHWRDLAFVADADIARAIRADRIDVLVELKGHTRGGRLAALAERPATVQLHYMGFPGTLGWDAIDGVIADAIVAPPGDEAQFHERVFRLPRSYFVGDAARGLPDRSSRSLHGLSDDAIVLASLNQSYKHSPQVFAVWMEALRCEPRSVLWLLSGHPGTQANLRAQAQRHGIGGERLVFAPAMPQEAHIARLRCADLALDTLPVGSHTTGADALWAGVPMLTCRGETFAGRVGASLLAAIGLEELVTGSIDEYRERLLGLVRDPSRLRDHAAHLSRGRATFPLWDTRGFTADFEALLERAYGEIVAAQPAAR